MEKEGSLTDVPETKMPLQVVDEVFVNMTEEQKAYVRRLDHDLRQHLEELMVVCNKCKRTVQLKNARIAIRDNFKDWFCPYCDVLIACLNINLL